MTLSRYILALALGVMVLSGCAVTVGKRYPSGMTEGNYIVCTPCIEIPNDRGTGFGLVLW